MSKSTKILVGILVVLGLIYAVQRLTSTTSTTENSKPFSGVDTSKVMRIAVDFGSEIVIAKQGSSWSIVSPIKFPADQGRVSMLLSRIAPDPSASVVAENLSDASAYGLGSSAPTLKIEQSNGKLISLRLGNLTPDFNGCYVQMQGEGKVLDLSTNIRTLAGQTLTNWREKKVFSFGTSGVQTIDLALGDTLYHFYHRDTLWQVNGINVPEIKAQDIAESLIGLTALDFVDSTVNVSKSLLDYGITLSNGTHITGRIFKLAESEGIPRNRPSSGEVCLSNSANNQVYIISSLFPTDLEQELREVRKDYLIKSRS